MARIGAVKRIAAAAVAGGAIALWLAGGVGLADLTRFIAYELGFVLLPGYLVLRALLPGLRSPAWTLALAAPIGVTLGILAFSLTAALGVRDLYDAYPLVVGVPAALVLWARRVGPEAAGSRSPVFSAGASWVIAGLCLITFAYIGIDYIAATPLPGTVPAVTYVTDVIFHLGLAGDALHHWPVESPGVAGESFGYHYFVHLHMAGIAQVTGIDLPVVVFRLYLVPLAALTVLQMALAGKAITGRAWAGPLAAALFLLVRAIDVSVSDWLSFDSLPGLYHLAQSPSQLLGLVVFLPILVVLCALLDPQVARRLPLGAAPRAGLWGVLVVLLAGAGGAKSTVLPLLIGGLILYLLWGRLRRVPLDGTAVRVLALCVVVYVVYFLTLYAGGTLGLRLDLVSTIKQMPPLTRLHSIWPGGLPADAAYWVLAVVVGTAMWFAAPLAGLPSALRRGPVGPAAVLSVSLLVAGLPAFFLIHSDYLEQLYFTLLGLIAVLPLSAGGLILFFEDPRRRPQLDWGRLAVLGAAWVAAVVVLALLVDRMSESHPIRADLLVYVPVAIAIAALVLVALRAPGRLGAGAAALAMLALLLTAALDTPLDLIPSTIRRLQHGEALYEASRSALRPRQYAGMRWIRAHTPDDAVLAVSDDRSPLTQSAGPTDEIWPAFTERRTFREAWVYTSKGNEAGARNVIERKKDPFPERTALERAVFRHADRGALRTMVQDFGVDYIVVSKKDGAVNPRVYRLGRKVFSNGAVAVIAV